MTDGNCWYYVLSPSLLFRLINKKYTRPLINGTALILGGRFIVWFLKHKYVYQHFKIEEPVSWVDIVKQVRRKYE